MTKPNGERDTRLVLALAVVVSVIAFVHYYRANAILMYGDAVAHINIARRVFDSRTPGLDQLGTVWLPLPHLLVLPLIVNKWMWRTGVGGSIPSMIAYIAGVLGIFRLVRDNLHDHARGCLAAWIAAIVYGGNPNLLYMQSTAMTESLSLALFVWALVFFTNFIRRVSAGETPKTAERQLWLCALMLSGEMLTRYDGWFVACALALVLLVFMLTRDRNSANDNQQRGTGIGIAVFVRFAALIALVPIFWFTYNYRLYGNPLEFATGPYSARAIAERTTRAGDPPYPGKDHPPTAALYFVKSAALNLGGQRLEGEYGHWYRKNWPQDGWYFVVAAGTLAIVLQRRWWLALLWLPLPFYSLSIAYGGVPIFVPSWWPYSYYNVRYGLQLLPLAAVCAGMVVAHARWWKVVAAIVLAFAAITYIGDWRTDPICLREASVNSRAREQLETQLAAALEKLPPDSSILMYTGEHVGALERAGVSLKRTINENNYYAWRLALTSPQILADYAVAFANDDVAKAVTTNPSFRKRDTFVVPGQRPAILYERVAR